jgi:hypothetical protein
MAGQEEKGEVKRENKRKREKGGEIVLNFKCLVLSVEFLVGITNY